MATLRFQFRAVRLPGIRTALALVAAAVLVAEAAPPKAKKNFQRFVRLKGFERPVLEQRYGYRPGRLPLHKTDWFAHYGFGHATNFEEFPDFFRISVGYGCGFQRSYLYGLQDYPGIGKPGLVVVRSRRDTCGQESKMFIHTPDTYWGFRIARDRINDAYQPEKPKKGQPPLRSIPWPRKEWAEWHDFAIGFDGTKAWVCVDGREDLTLKLHINPKKGRWRHFVRDKVESSAPVHIPRQTRQKAYADKREEFYLTFGNTKFYSQQRFFDVASVQFLEPGQTPKPPPAVTPVADGDHELAYESGKPRLRVRFKDGKPHGPSVRWHGDGLKESEGAFSDGKKHGPWRYWYANGQIRDEVIYDKGLRHGTCKRWAPDGQASRTFECVAGRRKGPVVKWAAPEKEDLKPR